ncbi:hypothetical protein os4_38520 (plasmid) [Comamonadaceae bacterium OS-4]|nr:hypothetical protein os4_38520 [Comamonadaceae bacterium OS-4]
MSVNWDADDTRQRTDLKIQRNQRPHGATPTPVLESKPPFRSSKTNRPRDASFPRAVYRQTWERLAAQRPEREACKTMVGLLVLAAEGHEAQLAQELEQLIELDQLPDLNALTQLLAPPKGDVPQVVVTLPALASYDELFEVAL